MSKTTIALIAFIAGCGAAVVAPLIIPPAHAQTTQRWETYCAPASGRAAGLAESISEIGTTAGRQGWEAFSTSTLANSGSAIVCFKRPAP